MGWLLWIIERDSMWAAKSRAWFANAFADGTRFDWFIVGAAIVVTIWFEASPPDAGIAIGFLAFFAAGMTLRSPTMPQRFIAIAIAGFLFILEARSIRIERVQQQNDANAQLKQILDDNEKKTKVMLADANAKFKATNDDFSGIASTERDISDMTSYNLNTTKGMLNQINGEHSYIMVVPRLDIKSEVTPLDVENRGENVLTGITISIYNHANPSVDNHEYIDLGTIPGGQWRPLPKTYWVSRETGGYTIDIYEQNGVYQEQLLFYPDRFGVITYKAVMFSQKNKKMPDGSQSMTYHVLKCENWPEQDCRNFVSTLQRERNEMYR